MTFEQWQSWKDDPSRQISLQALEGLLAEIIEPAAIKTRLDLLRTTTQDLETGVHLGNTAQIHLLCDTGMDGADLVLVGLTARMSDASSDLNELEESLQAVHDALRAFVWA